MINIRPEVLEIFKKYVEENPDQSALHMEDENYLNFMKLFPKDKIAELSLEAYCLGNPDDYPDNFCWWLEHGLTSSAGKYTPGNSNRHFIYWNKKDKKYIKNVTLSNLSDEDAMLSVAKLHAYIANLSPKENLDILDNDRELAIRAKVPINLALGNARKLRLTQIYYPKYFVNINSLAHMRSYLLFLGATKTEIKDLKEFPYQTAFLLRNYYLELNKLLSDLGGLSIIAFGKLWYTDIFDELLDNIWGNHQDNEEINVSENLNTSINQILYGPPGTGKTYKIQELARKKYIDEFFDEKLFLVNELKNKTWFDVIVFTLLSFDQPAKVTDIKNHKFCEARLSEGQKLNWGHIYNELVAHSVLKTDGKNCADSLSIETIKRRTPIVFDRNENNEWFIVESQKESIGDKVSQYNELSKKIENTHPTVQRYKIVTFHQSFSYEDFVEGISAETQDEQIKYSVKPGVFKLICEEAKEFPNKKFAIFIDEINRGNIANIFGELITLIEPDKRQGCENELSITLPYSKELFSVPNNLDIYGTMNTSDHSLTKLDLALRRRFEFVELLPDYSVLTGIIVHDVDMGKMLKTMNERIEILLGRDYLIGHSYFLELQDLAEDKQQEKLASIFQNKILPLLQEYFFEDWERIQWVLNDQNKEQAYQFIHLLSETRKNDLSRLFGNLQNMNQVPDRRYQINEDAFKKAEAYSQILAE